MVANPEMVVVDPDAPTDRSVKQAIMSVPTWESWLADHGFTHKEAHPQSASGEVWVKHWPNVGRGWKIVVMPTDFALNVYIFCNPFRYGKEFAETKVSEKSLPEIVGGLITEIERNVSDATKKRRIGRDMARANERRTGTMMIEAGPIRRPVPDDPAELDKSQMDQLLDRITTRCFLKGQRVQVTADRGALKGKKGTVVDAGINSCYVELDVYAEQGDSDPFRFQADELQSISESTEDLDSPTPYMQALDYVVPLKRAGYKPHPGLVGAKGYYKHITGAKGELEIKLFIYPNAPTSVLVYVDYKQGAEGDHVIDSLVDAIDVSDRVRELEEMFLASTGPVDYARKIKAKNYPHSSIPNREDHLIYLFGESIMEGVDPDDPAPYVNELSRHADVINVFRASGVRMSQRMTANKPYYRLFYIPSAVTDVSYDLFLEPQGDQSWKVTAEGSKEFQDQWSEDYQEEFEIDEQWNIPAGTDISSLEFFVADLLADLRKHTGPEVPTIHEPNVDDIDEGIDDPPESVVVQDRVDLLKQEGYSYGPDYKGNPHWAKKWPLALPIKTGKHTLTHLMVAPVYGALNYSLVDAAGRPHGGYHVKLPTSNTVATVTSLRRALLKVRHVAENMPVDANFNDIYSYLRVAFDKVQGAVDRESRDVFENEENIDFAQYAKDSASYTPTQLLTPKALRQIGREAGYTVHSCYHSNRTRGFTLKMYPATQEVLQQFLQFVDKEAYRVLEAYRQGIMKLLPALGKVEQGAYKLDDKMEIHCFPWGGLEGALPADPKYHVLFVSIQPRDHEHRGVGGILRKPKVNESVDEPTPDYYLNTTSARHCPKCKSDLTKPKAVLVRYKQKGNSERRIDIESHYQNDAASKYTVVWDVRLDRSLVDYDFAGTHCAKCGKNVHVSESLDDPDDPASMIKRSRAAKMGDLVTIICPKCGDKHEAFKNWPDGAPSEWGFSCDKCGAHIPLTHVVIESVDDPDADVDAAQYTDDTLNVPKTLEALGYRYDALAHFPHWAKYINPETLFVIMHEGGTAWQFQVYTPHEAGGGQWKLTTSSPGRQVSTLRPDLEKWEREARAGHLITDVNESVDEPNIDSFTRTTYDPAAFLAEQGWVLISDKKYHTKTIPVPVEYHMGNMVFTGIQFRIGTELSLFKSAWVSATFVGRDGTGFGIAGKDLMPQLLFAPTQGGDVPPDNHYDINMPIRRFATGIVDEMKNLAWPEARTAAPLANSKVKVAFDGLVNRLNEMSKEPLHPAIEESAEDDIDPASMLSQLQQQTYVLFVRRHDEDDEIAQGNYPDLPLEQALSQQLLRELAESNVFDMKTVSASGYAQPENQNIYHVRLLFTGQDSDVNLRDRLYDAIREAAVAGEFVIEQFRPEQKPKAPKRSRCRHCERDIQQENGMWVDPMAVGDDSMWRETCDANETFTADHEPMDYFSEALDPDDPEAMLKSQPGFHFQITQFMGEKVYIKDDPDNKEWPREIGNVVLGPAPEPPYRPERWYVINIRGIAQYDLSDYGFGISKTGKQPLRTFATKEDAALAIWMLRQEMEVTDGIMGLTRKVRKK